MPQLLMHCETLPVVLLIEKTPFLTAFSDLFRPYCVEECARISTPFPRLSTFSGETDFIMPLRNLHIEESLAQ